MSEKKAFALGPLINATQPDEYPHNVWCPGCDRRNMWAAETAPWTLKTNLRTICYFGVCSICTEKQRHRTLAQRAEVLQLIYTCLLQRYPELAGMLPVDYFANGGGEETNKHMVKTKAKLKTKTPARRKQTTATDYTPVTQTTSPHQMMEREEKKRAVQKSLTRSPRGER